jgi:outer membrane biosynthesis protein TonB
MINRLFASFLLFALWSSAQAAPQQPEPARSISPAAAPGQPVPVQPVQPPAEQLEPEPEEPPPDVAPQKPPPRQQTLAEYQQQVRRVQQMLVQFRPDAVITEEQQEETRQVILAITEAEHDAARAFVDRLVADLSTYLVRANIAPPAQTRFASSFVVALNSALYAPVHVERALGEIQNVLVTGGLARSAARTIVCDLHLLALELQPETEEAVALPR